jgi:acetylornithine deacetylase/succinyl-diaminopimelate desuccinylase-like protein
MISLSQFQDEALVQLLDFLRIPSVSALPEHKADLERAARFVETALERAGLPIVRVIHGEGHPLVYGEWGGQPGKPTLLLYGHYDVQPPDPLEEWHSPPFEPQVRGQNLYARGASDDKGQLWILIKAVEYLLRRDRRLPVNIHFLIEGEEECGGEHLERFLREGHLEMLADAALICDTEMFAPELPTICTGLRGIVYGELEVRGARQDLHSGVYGGVAPNPIMAVAEILCALKDRDGKILIPGFLDSIRPPAPEELAAWERLPFNETEYLEKEVRARALTGEPGYSVLERVWARPTLEVHGIRGGFTGEGAKTVIPARATAKLSMRLVPGQDPQRAIEQLSLAIAAACPPAVEARFHTLSAAPASLADPSNRFVKTAARALQEVFGNPTVYMRSGGSIPVVGLFQECLRVPSVLMGFGLPDDNLHSPNEKFYLPNFRRGIEAAARYLELLGE